MKTLSWMFGICSALVAGAVFTLPVCAAAEGPQDAAAKAGTPDGTAPSAPPNLTLPWNWAINPPASPPTAPAAALLLPVDGKNAKPKADEIQVTVHVGNNDATYNVKKGTGILDLFAEIGKAKYLTDSAMVSIYTVASVDAGGAAHGVDEAYLEDVAAVRAGKAKDVVLRQIDAPDYEIKLDVIYTEFDFPGGTPEDFVKAFEQHFGVDWSVVRIPSEMQHVEIPEFRDMGLNMVPYLRIDSTEYFIGGPIYYSTIDSVVNLYNQISDKYPAIGKWDYVDGYVNYYNPSIVLLTPPAKSAQDSPGIKVKALPLADIAEKNWDKLQKDIYQAADAARLDEAHANGGLASGFPGSVAIQSDSKILVIMGSPAYIDMAESIVAAYEKNEAIEKSEAPNPPPPQPPAKP